MRTNFKVVRHRAEGRPRHKEENGRVHVIESPFRVGPVYGHSNCGRYTEIAELGRVVPGGTLAVVLADAHAWS